MKNWTAKTKVGIRSRWESWKCRIPVTLGPSMQIFTAGQEFAFLSPPSPIFTDINMQKWAIHFCAAPSDIPSAKSDMDVLAVRLVSTT